MSLHVLRTPVNVTLRRFAHGSDAVSASWNFSLVGGHGGWQSDGCHILGHHDNFTTISCNSLGNYGLLMVGWVFPLCFALCHFKYGTLHLSINILCGYESDRVFHPFIFHVGPQQCGVFLTKHSAPAPGHLRHGDRTTSLPAHHNHQLHLPSQVRDNIIVLLFFLPGIYIFYYRCGVEDINNSPVNK